MGRVQFNVSEAKTSQRSTGFIQNRALKCYLNLASKIICISLLLSTPSSCFAEDILCRMCGEEISSAKYAHNRLSPDSISVKNQTNFDRNDIYFQVLENHHGMKFNLMTLFKSTCLEHGSWHAEYTWFPGFAWRVCLCPRCNNHLGWRFRSVHSVQNTVDQASSESFYGLNAGALVSLKAANSLIHSVEL